MLPADKLAIVQSYLNTNNLAPSFSLLLNERTLTNVRSNLLDEGILRYRTHLQRTPSQDAQSYVIGLHAIQLDLISKLFMLLEDYLSYSNLTRKSLVNLAESVASVKIELVRDEIKHLEQMNTEDISDYLLFRAVDELQLDIDDRQFIKERLKTFSDDVCQRIKRIVKFYKNYYRVYVKYKHIFSAIIGIYGITNNGEITSEIYIRDYKNEPATYVIPVHLGVLEYYERIKEDIITIFETLIFVYINHLQNLERPFLIPSGYFIPDHEKQRWYSIANNTNFLTVIDPNLRLNVDLGSEDKQKMQEILPENFIFKLDRDILMKDRRITGSLS